MPFDHWLSTIPFHFLIGEKFVTVKLSNKTTITGIHLSANLIDLHVNYSSVFSQVIRVPTPVLLFLSFRIFIMLSNKEFTVVLVQVGFPKLFYTHCVHAKHGAHVSVTREMTGKFGFLCLRKVVNLCIKLKKQQLIYTITAQ